MARQSLSDRPVAVKIFLPESVYARLRLEVWDGLRGNASYGKQSGLITRLLQEYFRRKERKQNDVLTKQMDGIAVDSGIPQEAGPHSASSGPEASAPAE